MLFQLEYRCLNPTYISHLKTMRLHQFIGFAFCLVCLPLAAAEYAVEPEVVELRGKYAQTQLVITQLIEGQLDPASDDVTATAVYKSSDPAVASVDSTGLVQAHANGAAGIEIVVGDWNATIPLTVSDVEASPKVDFDYSVGPILSKAGCNMGACHASQHGKGGFILSVFGFDSKIDYNGIVKNELERRVDFIEPTNSLFLLKPTMKTPHGGGRRLKEGTVMYNTLVDWLKVGALSLIHI